MASSPLFHNGLVAALGGCQIELEESNPDIEEPACVSTSIPL
jgi:hypothetical protein